MAMALNTLLKMTRRCTTSASINTHIIQALVQHRRQALGAGPARPSTVQWPLAAAYAFAVATQSSASKIYLVGFDGYSADDPRQEEMNDVFYKYSSLVDSLPITSLTPTTYRIDQSSIFSPKS